VVVAPEQVAAVLRPQMVMVFQGEVLVVVIIDASNECGVGRRNCGARARPCLSPERDERVDGPEWMQ